MSLRRVVDWGFAGIFAVLVAAPLVQMAMPLLPQWTLEERRPSRKVERFVPRLLRLDPALASDASNWFDDRYGFRDVLIRTKNEIDYRVFGVSEKVLIGRDGFLFDKSVMKSTDDNNREPGLAAEALASLRALRDCLASRHIKFVVVYTPDKRSIYPEALPAFAPKPGVGAAQELAAKLAQEPGIIFINGESLLLAHKNEPVFLRTDIHTTMRGGSLIYHAMLNKIAESFEMRTPPVRVLQYAQGHVHGSEGRFLGKIVDTVESVEGPANPAFPGDKNDAGVWSNNVGDGSIPGVPDVPAFDDVYVNHRTTPLLPPVLVFGTSFSGYMFAGGIQEAFKAAYRVKNNYVDRLVPALKLMPREVETFVFEYPEFMLKVPAKMPVRKACEAMPPR